VPPLKNSCAVPNVWHRSPADFNRPAMDARTPSSSSMTKIVGAAAVSSVISTAKLQDEGCDA
jgi:hypothetical protein